VFSFKTSEIEYFEVLLKKSRMLNAYLDVEHVMKFGGRESLNMVVMYTRSLMFERARGFMRDGEVITF